VWNASSGLTCGVVLIVFSSSFPHKRAISFSPISMKVKAFISFKKKKNRQSEFFLGVGMKCHVISKGKLGKGMVAEVGEAIDFRSYFGLWNWKRKKGMCHNELAPGISQTWTAV
jgi:hypothetical protein